MRYFPSRAGLVVVVALCLTVLGAVGCGDESSLPPTSCNATTCPAGCCSAAGLCQPWTAGTCGTNGIAGETCIACPAGNVCSFGICQGQANCNAANCPAGCCNAQDQCTLGVTANECGKGGLACQACGNGQQCLSQTCQQSQCDASSCPNGCCDASGNCLPGGSEGACGNGGAACKMCDGNDQCSAGLCKAPAKACDVTNCPNGCCDAEGNCITTPDATKCGGGGDACTACGSSQECKDGKCTCTTASCSGCCDGDTCKTGNTKAECGKSGEACQACNDPQTCISGACGDGCNASTCPGCCNGNQCNFGGATDASACGIGGASCVACKSGESCANGTCNNPTACDATSCATGCCAGGTCQLGTSTNACGKGGSNCQTCASYAFCSSAQKCEVKPTSVWQVTLHKIVLNQAETNWLDLTNAPDPYLELTTGTQTKQSSTKTNTYTPLYNEPLLSAKASDLMAAIKYVIWDDDTTSFDDKVVECDTKFTSAQLMAGIASLKSCPSDPQNKQVDDVVFTFTLISP